MLIAFLSSMLLGGLYFSFRRGNTIYTPFNLFSSGLLMYFAFYYLYLDPSARQQETYYAFLVAIICFYVGTFSVTTAMLKPLRDPLEPIDPWKIKIALFIVGYFVLFYIYFAFQNIMYKQSMSLETLYDFKDSRAIVLTTMTIWERVITAMQKVLLPAYLLSIGYLKASHLKHKWAVILGATSIALLTSLTQYTGRSNIIIIVLTVMVLFFNAHPRFEMIAALICGLALVLILNVLGFVRHGRLNELENMKATELFQQLGEGGEWEPMFIIEDLNEYQKQLSVREHLDFVANDIWNWTINWIPRVIWPDKPFTDFASRMTGEMYGNILLETPWTRTFTTVGQGLVWGGMVGVAINGYLYGLFTSLIFRKLGSNIKYHGAYCYLIGVGCFNFRNAFTTWVFMAVTTIIEIWILDKLLFQLVKSVQIVKKKMRSDSTLTNADTDNGERAT